ncbi:unnamed protein product [Calypogeia fissa]
MSGKRPSPRVAIAAESSPVKAGPDGTNGKPQGTLKDDRVTRIDELEQKLERLGSMIEALKEEVKERAVEDAGAGTMDPVCNNCLARKKGAALFPCGHTFCWKCTSALRRGRGPCPSCNHYFWSVLRLNEVP